MDLGDQRAFVSPDPTGRGDRLILSVVNLETLSKAEAKYGVTVANYELFEESGTLSDWVSKVLALWKSIDVDFDLVQQAPGGYVYEVGDPGGQRELIVLVLSNGQPLGLTLEGRGTFQDPATFVEALLPDLLTMTRSLSAPTQTRSGGTTERSTPLAQKSLGLAPLDMGPYFGDSGYRTSDAYTYRLQDDYYEAPPRSYWLYEYMYYENYAWHQTYLYRTAITMYPPQSCRSGGSYDIYRHSIGKSVSTSTGIAIDSYYPNVIVSQLSGAAHIMVFGDPAVVECMWYFPYTH